MYLVLLMNVLEGQVNPLGNAYQKGQDKHIWYPQPIQGLLGIQVTDFFLLDTLPRELTKPEPNF